MPKLILTTQSQGRIAYDVTESLVTIGRATDNMIIIDHPSVSGHHAQLERSGELYRLRDLESTNGTRVNGVPITDTVLRFDDRVRFGAVDTRFEPDARGSQPMPVLEKIHATPAEISAAPVDFGNASPFPRRGRDRDPVRSVLLAIAAVAILTFVGCIIAVLIMQGPNL
jgi:hypothetical protein